MWAMRGPFPLVAVGGVLVCAAAACSSSQGEHTGTDHSPDTGRAGFCRATTCPTPSEYPTVDGQCEPDNWGDSPFCVGKKASNAPVWWRTACVGYDLQQDASRHVSYDAFATAASNAFGRWTGASCPSMGGPSRASIDVRDLGPVPCARATYDPTGPNQNVVVFHDDTWPYEQKDMASTGSPKSLTVALTTITFDPETGELFDADIELNSADYNILPLTDSAPPAEETFDLESVLAHETGHFFGMAHSPLSRAVMYADGDTSSGTSKRFLTAEDVDGICAIYPPNGTRSVSILAVPSQAVIEGSCDPTPRHGFAADCGS
jgi:hypothetical protein